MHITNNVTVYSFLNPNHGFALNSAVAVQQNLLMS
jgi:hypothetical protein